MFPVGLVDHHPADEPNNAVVVAPEGGGGVGGGKHGRENAYREMGL